MRTGDKDWLAQCPPEQREEVRKLELEASGGAAVLLEGPHVIIPEEGVELRDGPVEAKALISTPSKGIEGYLFGTIRTGSDGASIQFTRFKLFDGSEPRGQPPAGREIKVCAIVSMRGWRDDPGIPKVPPPYKLSKPHPGFVWVMTKALEVHFAN